MIYCYLGIFFLVVGIGLGVFSTKSWRYDWVGIPAILLISVAIICFLIPGIAYLDFSTWEQSFMLMSDAFSETNFDGNYVYIWDIANANRELFEYQASYLRWGEWSCIPARVMDIVPIG